MSQCKWCKQEHEDSPGGYYQRKRCHRDDVLRRIDTNTDPGKAVALVRELELASFTGD